MLGGVNPVNPVNSVSPRNPTLEFQVLEAISPSVIWKSIDVNILKLAFGGSSVVSTVCVLISSLDQRILVAAFGR